MLKVEDSKSLFAQLRAAIDSPISIEPIYETPRILPKRIKLPKQSKGKESTGRWYSESNWLAQYRDPRWQKLKSEMMIRDGFICQHCSDAETTLNVHHIYYVKGWKVWEYPPHLLITLCEDCHKALPTANRTLLETTMRTSTPDIVRLCAALRRNGPTDTGVLMLIHAIETPEIWNAVEESYQGR